MPLIIVYNPRTTSSEGNVRGKKGKKLTLIFFCFLVSCHLLSVCSVQGPFLPLNWCCFLVSTHFLVVWPMQGPFHPLTSFCLLYYYRFLVVWSVQGPYTFVPFTALFLLFTSLADFLRFCANHWLWNFAVFVMDMLDYTAEWLEIGVLLVLQVVSKRMLHFSFWNFSAFKAAMIKVKDILVMPCPCSYWRILYFCS